MIFPKFFRRNAPRLFSRLNGRPFRTKRFVKYGPRKNIDNTRKLVYTRRFSTAAASKPEETNVKENKDENKAKTLPQESDSTDIRRLWQYTKTEWKLLAQGSAMLLISSGVTMTVPIAFGTIVDIAQGNITGYELNQVLPILGVVFLTGGLCNSYRIFCFQKAGHKVILKIRQNLYKSITAQEIAFFDSHKTGDLITRLSSDTTLMGTALAGNSVAMGLRTVTQCVGSFGLMYYLSPQLFGVMMGVIPIAAIGTKLYGNFVKTTQEQAQKSLSEATSVAEERIGNIRTLRCLGVEAKEGLVYDKKIENVFDLSMVQVRGTSVFWGSGGAVVNLFMLAVLGYGGHMVQAGLITTGTLTSFLMYSLNVTMTSFGVAGAFAEIMRGVGASKRVFYIMDRQSQIPNVGGELVTNIKGEIDFQNVNFAYPNRIEDKILRDFNCKVEPGKSLALVGRSGSGKSTIMNILLRLFDVDSGNILLDGKNIKDLDPTSLRQQIGIVPQEPVLFTGTIFENLCFALTEYDAEDPAFRESVYQCAKEANAHDFIMSFPDGYDTEVGERGVNLSGGQKQRIAIARALLSNPKILLLDEATSALDAASEQLVADAIDRAMKNRTVIVIAHRLSTIRDADNIGVLHQGQIDEYGTHESLLADPKSRYSKLMAAQLSYQD